MKQREEALVGIMLMVLVGALGLGYTVGAIAMEWPWPWMLWIMVGFIDALCLWVEWSIGADVWAIWKGRG